MKKRRTWISCLMLVCLLPLPLTAYAWSGEVVGITDGDTITVLNSKTLKDVKIRLYGIDTPERAKMDKLGLWADPKPIPPWEFRRKKRRK